ncbi:unnamed protein product [Owenia fusiformis]|uniref:Uncharacterized protein n=1 Tax=Owenia fusiformis TaxID=6347 RepID=A0A8J1UIW9_OWEFU|nr:unnamed protein product [Owenia fusiformis]
MTFCKSMMVRLNHLLSLDDFVEPSHPLMAGDSAARITSYISCSLVMFMRLERGLNCFGRLQILMISFTSFEVEDGGSNCTHDFLQINDGPSVSSPLIGRFCGNHPPINISGTNNQLYLWFSSDSTDVRKGFEVTYTATDIPTISPTTNETETDIVTTHPLATSESISTVITTEETTATEETTTEYNTIATPESTIESERVTSATDMPVSTQTVEIISTTQSTIKTEETTPITLKNNTISDTTIASTKYITTPSDQTTMETVPVTTTTDYPTSTQTVKTTESNICGRTTCPSGRFGSNCAKRGYAFSSVIRLNGTYSRTLQEKTSAEYRGFEDKFLCTASEGYKRSSLGQRFRVFLKIENVTSGSVLVAFSLTLDPLSTGGASDPATVDFVKASFNVTAANQYGLLNYTGPPELVKDYNECTTKVSNDCHANATCLNQVGSYTCVCQNGFMDESDDSALRGRICKDQVGLNRLSIVVIIVGSVLIVGIIAVTIIVIMNRN